MAFQKRTFEIHEHCCLHILKLLNSFEDTGFSNQTLLFEADQDHSIQGKEQGIFLSLNRPYWRQNEVVGGKPGEKKKQAGVQQQRIKIGSINRLLRCHYIPFWIFSTGIWFADCQQPISLIPHQYSPREENVAYILISAPLLAQKVEVYLVSLKVQSYWLGRWYSVVSTSGKPRF